MACFYRSCLRPKDCKIREQDQFLISKTKILVLSAEQLRVGDAISFGKRFYKHHAIVSEVVHAGRFMIIHLTGDSNDSIRSFSGASKVDICETAIDLSQNKRIYKYIFNQTRDADLTSEEPRSVRIARHIQKHCIPNFHNLTKFNCEHFVTYCVTGFPFCRQSDVGNYQAKRILDTLINLNVDDVMFLTECYGKASKLGTSHQYLRSARQIIKTQPCTCNSVCPSCENDTTDKIPLLDIMDALSEEHIETSNAKLTTEQTTFKNNKKGITNETDTSYSEKDSLRTGVEGLEPDEGVLTALKEKFFKRRKIVLITKKTCRNP